MNTSESDLLKNITQLVSSSAFLETHKIVTSPEALKAIDSAVTVSASFDTRQLNSVLEQIGLLPNTEFQEIKSIVYKNRSHIYDIAKENMEAVSSPTEQLYENNNETIIMSEQAAELVSIIDDSVKFPEPGSDKKIHIKKSDKFHPIIKFIFCAIFSVALPFYNTYQNNSTSELLQKNHSEQMQAIYRHDEQLENLNQEIKNLHETALKILQSLQKIEENISLIPRKN